MAAHTLKLVLDTAELNRISDELGALASGLPEVAHNVFTEFLRVFVHLPTDFFVCAQERTALGAGDGIVRLSIRAPQFEVLAAALTALVAGLELTHGFPPPGKNLTDIKLTKENCNA